MPNDPLDKENQSSSKQLEDLLGPQPQSNINSLIILITLVVIALFVAGFFAGTKIAYVNIENDGITPNIYSDGEFDSLSNNSELYLNIWNTVEKEYLTDKVDEEQLMYGSIRGMVDALDDNYSKFLDPAENEMQLNDNAGKYEGIGVYLEYNTTLGYTYIESVIDGFPAQEAGVMSGDLVLEVDGEFMDGKRPSYVASKILGEDGTEVKIKFYSQTEENAFEKVIIRKKIDNKQIEYEDMGRGIYYIKIRQFTESSITEFQNQWDQIIKEINAEKPKGIILDLRNNPGGYVDSAIHVSEEFLDEGSLILVERSREEEESKKVSTRKGAFIDTPLCVLVNGGSASASEIVSGALQDNARAILIGQETFGKGVEQKVINYPDGSSLHLVYKQWLTPSYREISQTQKIIPDIEINLTRQDVDNDKDPQLDKAKEEILKRISY